MKAKAFKRKTFATLEVKIQTALLLFTLTLFSGVLGGVYVKDMIHSDSDGRQVKTPIWQPVATREYKNYKFTHVDYLQPQYVNMILDEKMLAEVKADITAGIISVANLQFGVEIGDIVKLTADDHMWLHISKKDPTHRFREIIKE